MELLNCKNCLMCFSRFFPSRFGFHNFSKTPVSQETKSFLESCRSYMGYKCKMVKITKFMKVLF